MNLREHWLSPFTLSQHVKPTQIMLKRRGFFTTIHNNVTLALTWLQEGGVKEGGGGLRREGGCTPHMGDASSWNQILSPNLHHYCNQNCTFLFLVESISFLHITLFLCSIFFFFVKFCSTLKLILDLPLLFHHLGSYRNIIQFQISSRRESKLPHVTVHLLLKHGTIIWTGITC